MIEYKVEVYSNGSEAWYLDDRLHRENGPTITYVNGAKRWYLNGKQMSEEEHKAAMNPPVEEMTMEEICEALGKNVKVIK